MKAAVVFLALIGLAACDTGARASKPPQNHEPAATGVSVSGYGRAGVSHTF
ncbi:hypothetical protein [Leisingera methylohalidivorans]|uniref:Uncharacterized protein n=1 Tax=Leisingera methylohalidivorans DSM 14336 TaxID=999552 RepID=V9VSM9_9RHOB|nr:hypothetical protein [Leisingera methylohalidivorans]AHC99861.1 hypothetical protein METH_03220 [Leisingera methylohalidivorans DSM 14336]